MLVDSGATHNFISRKLVKAMGWKVEETVPLRIKMGDGYKAQTQGECKKVLIEIGQMQVSIDAVLFDLDDIDLVLAMAWLTNIGGMWVDWVQQVMRFRFNNEWAELKGERKEDLQQLALQSLLSRPNS